MAEAEAWITGIGIVSCLGEGPDAHWNALNASRPQADTNTLAPYIIHPLAPVDFDKQIPKKGDQRQMEPWQRTGAYAAGRLFGKHKLYPRISPAKTWEGFIGGLLAAIGAAFATRAILLPDALSVLDCVLLGLLGGIGGPLGDLAESMLKRAYAVKDSGNILPGHGGMLDRVDALMINAPLVYFYARIVLHQGE